MSSILNQAKANLDRELDKAEKIGLERWRRHVQRHELKEVTDTTAMVSWTVPSALSKVMVAGHKWPEGSNILEPDELHVTIKYLGEQNDKDAEKVREWVERTSSELEPFDVEIQGVDVFESVEEGKYDAVHLKVSSLTLEAIKKLLDKQVPGLREDTYDKYNPHITLAYVPVGSTYTTEMDEEIDAVTVDNITYARGGKFDVYNFGVLKGGKGSGNFGHGGRPGKIGGSSSTPQSDLTIGHLPYGMTVYHVTDRSNLEAILDEGFKPSSETGNVSALGEGDYDVDGVFFANGPQAKVLYDQMAEYGDPAIISANLRAGTEVVMDDLMPESSIIVTEKLPAFILNQVSYSDVENTPAFDDIYKQLPIDDDNKRVLLQARINIFNDESDELAEQVYNGDISIGQWQEEMKGLIKGLNTSTAAIAKGGWDMMGPRDWGRLGTPNREQYKFLKGFAQDISDNRATISLAYIQNRARLYGQAAGGVAAQIEAGFWFEDNLPWLPRDGSTSCLMQCHCRWVLRIIEERDTFNIVEAVWELGEADHCTASVDMHKDGCVDRDGHREIIKTPLDVYIPDKIGGY